MKRRCKGPCGLNRQLTSYPTPAARICKFCQRIKRKASARKAHLDKTYGITPEEYARLLAEFEGTCWMCNGTRPYSLPVDHDHSIGDGREAVRGLLCKRDNKLLAIIRDDPTLLQAAVDYLFHAHNIAQRILKAADTS